MRYRSLGTSDLQVPEISFGSWLTLGAGLETKRSQACIRRCLDLGINFFDTANVYAGGAAESFIGETLAGIERSSYMLATKAYFPMPDGARGLSAEQIKIQSHASLRRLNTDYVDLYQCHRYDNDTPLEETMTALTRMVEHGHARYIGFSEWAPDQIQAARDLVGDDSSVASFISSQPEYSILWRKPEVEVFGLCDRLGIGQIVWSPLAQGALTGKYRPGTPAPADSRGASSSMGSMMGRWRSDEVLGAVDNLRPLARDLGLTMAQLALAWVLRKPEVTSAIVGASRPEQLDDNAAASGVLLDATTLEAIDEAVNPVRET